MLAFFAKTQRFLAKIVPLLTAIVWKLCLRLFSSIFIFSKIKCFYKWKHKFYNYASGIRFPDWSKIGKITVMSQFLDMTSSLNFFDAVLFVLSILVTGPSFMSTPSLLLELWQFSIIRDWLEIRKLEILPSDFCSISAYWGE